MDIVPPPMGSTSTNPSSILEGEDDDDSLFAVVGQQKKGTGITATSTSGYDSSEATSTNEAGNILSLDDDNQVARSNTMDDFEGQVVDVNLDDNDNDDDMFKSARGLEPEPEKRSINLFGNVNGNVISDMTSLGTTDREIPLEDEDEKPFQDVHLKPQLQLSAGGHQSTVAGVDNSLNGSEIGSSANISSGVDNTNIMPKMDLPPENLSNNTETASLVGKNVNSSRLETTEVALELEERDEFIEIKVTSPHKVGEGMSSYMTYKVSTKTNVNYFKKSEMSVDRRFSDFLGLHDKLSEKYLQNGRIIPPAPDKSVVGMTRVKMSKESDTEVVIQDEFVEKRRAALERFLNRTAAHASLRTDPDFREFLELETELPRASQTATFSGRNVMKMINKVGDSITNITLKLEETDDWFEEKNNTIEQLETQLRKLHQSTESLVIYRKDLGYATNNMGKTMAILSVSEENSALSAAIAQLSSVHEKISSIHHDQASVEFYELSELIKDYLGLVGAVKDVFHERVKAWQTWQSTTANLTKKREAKVKAELGQKMERIGALRQEIAELERQQDMAQENFDRISRLIRKEVEVFDLKKAEDFKTTIIRYLETMLSAQEQIAEQWERYLPELKVVNV